MTGYSAKVRLTLLVEEASLDLAEIGPELIYLRHPIDLPPCDATILMTVDGREHRWKVYLPDGLSANAREARTCDRQPAAAAAGR